MKILWLSHLIPYPPTGGVLQRSYNMVKEVAKHHELHLIAFVQKDLLLMNFDTVEQGIYEAEKHLGGFCKSISFISIPCDNTPYGKHRLAAKSLFSKNTYTVNWLESAAMRECLIDFSKENDIDLVHYDTISLAPYRDLFPDIPSCLDHHNIESHMMLRRASNTNNLLLKAYYQLEGLKLQRYEVNQCRKFTINITCSELDSERLTQLDPSFKPIVIENGVDLDFFSPSKKTAPRNKDGALRFIFAGRLNAYTNKKAVQELVHTIWPLIQKTFSDAILDIVGANPPADVLAASSKNTSIKTHGFVEDVRPYIDNANIYLCPITDGGGTKLKILDALAMGKALISTPIACEGIDVSNGENVLFASSPQDFLDQVDKIYNNPDMIEALGLSARKLICDKYSYTSIGEKLSTLYQKHSKSST